MSLARDKRHTGVAGGHERRVGAAGGREGGDYIHTYA